MAIIPGQFCEDCAEDGDQTPAEHEWDARFMDSGGLFLCERHADRRIDAASEPDYGAVTISELCERARAQRRELRKRD